VPGFDSFLPFTKPTGENSMTNPSNSGNKQTQPRILPIIIGLIAGVTCFAMLQAGSCRCNSTFDFWRNAKTPKLPVVRQDRMLEPFTKIRVATPVKVTLKAGTAGTAVVETHEDLQEYLTTKVEKDTLIISLNGSFRNIRTMAVELPVEQLEKISVSSTASVVGETTITGDDLEIETHSAGSLRLAVDVKRLTCRASSASCMTLSGSAVNGNFHADSAARIDAAGLNLDSSTIDASSAAYIEIGKTQELSMKKSSAASIHYQGTPQVRNQ
jgi:hypothetical protein